MHKMSKTFIILVVFIFGILLCACSNNNVEIKDIENEIDELINNDSMTSDEKMENIFAINNEIAILDDEKQNQINNYDELKAIEKQTIKNIVKNSERKNYMNQAAETYYKFNDIMKDEFNCDIKNIERIEWYDDYFDSNPCNGAEGSQKDKLCNFFNNIPYVKGSKITFPISSFDNDPYMFEFVLSNENHLNMRLNVWFDDTKGICQIVSGDIVFSGLIQCNMTKLDELIAIPEE